MIDRPPETVYSAIVDLSTVDELFREVETACESASVRVKRPGRSIADKATVSFAEARSALEGGIAVQLRYQHDGVAWSDTLAPESDGIRLLRCRLPGT
jgi:hypothetical protein